MLPPSHDSTPAASQPRQQPGGALTPVPTRGVTAAVLILTQSILGTFNNLWSNAAALVSQVLRPFSSLSTTSKQPPPPRRRSSTPSSIVMPGRRWSTHRRGSVTAVCYSPKSDCNSGLPGPLDPLDDAAPAPLPEGKDEGTGMRRLQESEDEPEEGEEVGLKPEVVQVECTDTRRSGAPLSPTRPSGIFVEQTVEVVSVAS